MRVSDEGVMRVSDEGVTRVSPERNEAATLRSCRSERVSTCPPTPAYLHILPKLSTLCCRFAMHEYGDEL